MLCPMGRLHVVRIASVLMSALALSVALAMHMWPSGSVRHIDVNTGLSSSVARACELRDGNHDIRDLQDKGFAVLPGFLSSHEVAKYLGMYSAKADGYDILKGSARGCKTLEHHEVLAAPGVEAKVSELLIKIQNQTNIYVGSPSSISSGPFNSCADMRDKVMVSAQFFHTNASDHQTAMLDWHQDVELGFLWPDAYNNLNLYIFLEKPMPDRAGLSFIPFDGLRSRSPELHDAVKGRASKDFLAGSALRSQLGGSERETSGVPVGNLTAVMDYERDEHILYHSGLEELSCTPEMTVGDAIVFRGDLIHRTQPHAALPSWRTSMNLRISPGGGFGNGRIIAGGITKFESLNDAPRLYISAGACGTQGLKPVCRSSLEDGLASSVCQGIQDVMVGTYFYFALKVGLWYRRALWPVRSVVGRIFGESLILYRDPYPLFHL